MADHNKVIPKNKESYMRHYLRFVKTLWEINENNKKGKKSPKTLDDLADIVKEPLEFYFTL